MDKMKKKEMDPIKADAKLSALKSLRKVASDAMQDDMGKMKSKVTVAASDKEGLKKGLEKAKELVGGSEGSPDIMEKMEEMAGKDLDGDNEEGESSEHKEKVLGKEESPEHEASELMQEESAEHGLSAEEIDEMMAKLAEMKSKLAKT